MEAELKKLEDDRRKQVEEMDKLTAARKAMESDREKHKSALEKMEAERLKGEAAARAQQEKWEADLERLREEKARLAVRCAGIYL